MKTTITEDGNLVLTPEGSAETYFLPTWFKDFAAGKVGVHMDNSTTSVKIHVVPKGKWYASGDMPIDLGGGPQVVHQAIVIQMSNADQLCAAQAQCMLSWDPSE